MIGRPRSLALQLTSWYAAGGFLLLLTISIAHYAVLTASLDREDDHYLAEKVAMFETVMYLSPGDAVAIDDELRESEARLAEPVYIRILDPAGGSLAETDGMDRLLPPSVFPDPTDGGADSLSGVDVEGGGGRIFRIASARVESPAGQAVVQVGLDRTAELVWLASYRRWQWTILAGALLVLVVVGHAIARRGLSPVGEISERIRRIGSDDLGERIETATLPGELAGLATTFNRMMDRLEEAFERVGRFSADIAHELRTPLQNLRVETEVALQRTRGEAEYRSVLESGLEEYDRLVGLIEGLLFLARSEQPEFSGRRGAVDVARELANVADVYRPMAEDQGLVLEIDAPETLAFELDRTLFQRALGNLVANALTHGRTGRSIRIRAALAGPDLEVEVADDGAGIESEHLDHIFDRFYRADPSRSKRTGGFGLGLSIVRSIARLHGGEVEIESRVGRGTTVRLRLPPGGPSSGCHLGFIRASSVGR